FAVLLFVVNLVVSYFRGKVAGNDPWDAWTLEWSLPSPPPAYNFATIPTVASRRPLWDLKHPEDPDSRYERGGRSHERRHAPAPRAARRRAPALSRHGGHGLLDHRRSLDIHDLRRGLPLLRGEEPQRTDSPRGSGDAVLLHGLPLVQQLHHPLRG